MTIGRGRCLVVTYGHAVSAPPVMQAAAWFRRAGHEVCVLQGVAEDGVRHAALEGIEVRDVPGAGPGAGSLTRWHAFRRELASVLDEKAPRVVVAIMLHALAALPRLLLQRRRGRVLVSCVYDIPVWRDAGHLDRVLLWKGWRRLRCADVVWASDPFKAELAVRRGLLRERPMVAHNCPPAREELQPPDARDAWLRSALRAEGAELGRDSVVMVRAGAIGPYGGIEATLEALRRVPQVVFLMMGRPSEAYAAEVHRRILACGLTQRVFVWNRPDDERWEAALRGADVGHLLHGPYPPGPYARLGERNSILSANRLFQYMMAGLPILAVEDRRLQAFLREAPCVRTVRGGRLEEDLPVALAELCLRQERVGLGLAAQLAYGRTYNWGKQFDPVVSRVEKLLSENQGYHEDPAVW